MSVAVIADAHIDGPGGEPGPLIDQLRELRQRGCRHLILLGDLFQTWIGQEAMAGFESAYRDWIELKPGRRPGQRRQKLERFVRSLYQLKNVYPTRRLHDCDSGEGVSKFILGRTSLGSDEP